MTREELEFSISQYVDGTLADRDRAALERRLADDGEAQGLLDEDRSITMLLKRAPMPLVRWDQLSERVSAGVAEELGFFVSQYVDGTLGDQERAAMERRLERDAEARAMLGDYRSLNLALKGMSMPPVRWDVLAGRISTAVAGHAEPAQSYRIGWARWAGRAALAASVLIATGFGVQLLQTRTNPLAVQTIARAPIVIDATGGPTAFAAITPSDRPIEITVGPSDSIQGGSVLARYHDGVLYRRSQVIIASGGAATQDGINLPY